MIKNYLRIAFRTLRKNLSYVIINTFGLGIALACCITAYLLLAYNIEFDEFHADEKVSNVYKVHAHIREKSGQTAQDIGAPLPLGPMAAADISGIVGYTRFVYGGGYVRYGDNAFSEGIAFADSTFFSMFDFPLVKGSHLFFNNKHSIFLNEEMATKYFGSEDPVGKMMVLNFPGEKQIEVIVGGVLDKVPLNNSFVFDLLMRIENFYDIYDLSIDSWGDWRDPVVFLTVASPEQAKTVGEQMAKYIPIRNDAKEDVTVTQYKLEPFKSNFNQDTVRNSNVNLRINALPLIVFVSMAVLILLIACFNLTNTSIAMTSKRLKEVGVRKTVGAARSQIVFQFLFETVVTILLALIAGLIMAQFIVPTFVTMWNLRYGMEDLNGLNLFVALLTMVFLAALLAGMYPALFNSRFKPVALLKGAVKISGTNGLTRTLVALQFALSVIVLVAGVIFIQNNKFQEAITFGYDKEGVITVNVQGDKDFKVFENAIRSNPKIMNVAVSDHQVGYSTYRFPVTVDTTSYEARLIGVGKNYFETMGFRFAAGRSFDLDNASDQEEAVIVNQAFVDMVGMTDPLDRVVQVHEFKRRIVGVLENHVDFLYNDGSNNSEQPFVFYPSRPTDYKIASVQVNPEDRATVQQYLEKTWKQIFPTKPFESRMQDDIVMENTKETNSNLEKIFLFLTVLGGLLSASGIFALSSLNIAKRTKEIGIRKALGASITNIVGLLNREFVITLLIAGVLGSLGGYFLTNALLDQIYRIHISIGILSVTLCALTIFALGIFTTSSTILKAARSNPVDTLRSE